MLCHAEQSGLYPEGYDKGSMAASEGENKRTQSETPVRKLVH